MGTSPLTMQVTIFQSISENRALGFTFQTQRPQRSARQLFASGEGQCTRPGSSGKALILMGPPEVQSPAEGPGLRGTQSHTGRALAFKVPLPRSTLPTLLPLALRMCFLSFNYTGI